MTNPSKLLIVGALLCSACAGIFGAPKSPERKVFECEVAALKPYVKDVLDAEELVRDAYSGKADINRTLAWLGTSHDKVREAAEAFKACSKPSEPKVPDAGAPS